MIGTASTTTGDTFAVVQYWNGGLDGFMTEAIHINPNGKVLSHTLDADDDRCSSVPITVDENSRSVIMHLSGQRDRRIRY